MTRHGQSFTRKMHALARCEPLSRPFRDIGWEGWVVEREFDNKKFKDLSLSIARELEQARQLGAQTQPGYRHVYVPTGALPPYKDQSCSAIDPGLMYGVAAELRAYNSERDLAGRRYKAHVEPGKIIVDREY
jgi:hypothetical protein